MLLHSIFLCFRLCLLFFRYMIFVFAFCFLNPVVFFSLSSCLLLSLSLSFVFILAVFHNFRLHLCPAMLNLSFYIPTALLCGNRFMLLDNIQIVRNPVIQETDLK